MLKKLNKYETQHILNVRKVEKMIDRHFYKACQDTAFLTYGLDARLSDDALFSFADYPYLTRRLNKILDTLKNRTFMTVVSGIKASWDLSKTKNDNLVHSLFGEGLDAARFNRYYSTRTGAVNAFIKRVDNGLSLSDKVWKYTERFKNEIELGIDCGLRDGLSAPEIARSLKMYLQYPDKLFRRVRTQHGILKLSKTAAAFHPGQGVYRSSYKNARRLAATETNIAYRTADFERWQDFDFVVGIEIKLSNNHTLNGKPFTDICDKLAGKYPKDFKFVGWHPLCRCHALSILKTPKEIAEDMKRERQGLPPIPLEDSTNAITSLPDNFNDWASANSDRIQRATRRGTLPYFLADNFNVGKNGELVRKTLEAKPKTEETKTAAPPKLSLLQRAEQRHKARTVEEVAELDKIEQAKAEYLSHNAHKWEQTYFDRKTGGYVVTDRKRVVKGRINKQERQKLKKETMMCMVFAKNGYKVEMLEEVPRISSPDVKINGKLADLKSTKGASNIVKYAHKAIKQQKADIIIFEFEQQSIEIEKELDKLRRQGINGFYYYKEEKKVHKL